MDSRELLVIVDMQKDFLDSDGALYLGHETHDLQCRLSSIIENFSGDLLFTQDFHQERDHEFSHFPKHCIAGSGGEELVPKMKQAIENWQQENPEREMSLIRKSSFTDIAVGDWVKDHSGASYDRIFFTGVCTHICLHDVVSHMANYAKITFDKMPEFIVLEDLVDDFDREMASFSLRRLELLYGVKLLESCEVF